MAKEYKLVQDKVEDLEEHVNQLLQEGWVAIGAPVAVVSTLERGGEVGASELVVKHLAQALIR